MEISLTSGAPSELAAKNAIEHLLGDRKVNSYLYSKRVCLSAGAVPKAFPVITLNSDDVEKENLLLSNFLHHQFRWFVSLQGEKTDDGIDALKRIFPLVPVDGIETSANTIYLQLIVCALEYFALVRISNEATAKNVVLGKTDFPWVYSQIIEKAADVKKALKSCRLLT